MKRVHPARKAGQLFANSIIKLDLRKCLVNLFSTYIKLYCDAMRNGFIREKRLSVEMGCKAREMVG